MSDFEKDLQSLIEETRGNATDADKVLARLDHQLGYLHSISVSLDALHQQPTKSSEAAAAIALLAELRAIKWFLMFIAVIGLIALTHWWPDWWYTPWWPKISI